MQQSGQDYKLKCLDQVIISQPCQWTNTSKLKKREETLLLEEGKHTTTNSALQDESSSRFSPASLEQPTSSEQLQIDSEMDGTVAGEDKAEEKRQKDEKWAQFKDANQRGAGNTMNRG
jgi:hypothetical protein